MSSKLILVATLTLTVLVLTGCKTAPQLADRQDAAATIAVPPATQPEVNADVLKAFTPREVTTDGNVALRYQMLSPAVQEGVKYPLVIFLHGSGERGSDNYRQLIHGGKEFLHHSQRHPAFYVFPQCPKGIWWSTPNKLREEVTPPGVVPPMPELLKLIDRLIAEQPIDRSRVYMAGLSMGGFGTYDIVAMRPQLFAAAIPMCGGGDVSLAAKYRSTPFWIFHGDADTAVDIKYSRDMTAAMKAAGVKFIYTEYAGGNHNAWTPTLTNDAVIDWMFAQQRQ